MNLRIAGTAGLAGVLLLAAACSGGTIDDPQPGAPLTALPRDLTGAEHDVLAASMDFAFALWKQINAGARDSNVFVSPLSASFALGMAMNGAAGPTLDDMRAGLRFGSSPLSDIDAGYHSLIGLLTSLDPKVAMQIANSIWYRNTFSFNQSFLDAGSSYFDATIDPLNFDDQAGSLAAINGWVKSKTNGRIPSIIDEIRPENVMFVINAIYFKGSWRSRFDSTLTLTSPFHAVAGDQSVKLMHRKGSVAYTEAATFQAVDLPYGDSAFAMTVVLPKTGTSVEDVAASLDAAAWQRLTPTFATTDVDLYLPRLTLAWQRDLIPDLQELGMHAPFVRNGADFTAMSPLGKQLYISLVRQKTFVDVNEEGTEAAAVTGVGVSVTAVEVTPVMRVDRPYIFAIRERLTGTVIFLGKITNIPSA
ncbi:MAG TPA: serpin family protein, partial [Gemmatimonadaceae bacterium]|jgi:serpin B|nr:serpin family protein [Gemmatimonadaceae bacterium]